MVLANRLTKESSPLTTFIITFGRPWFNRVPFGITSAPEYFQKYMSDILLSLPGVICMIDDNLVNGSSQEEHDQHLSIAYQHVCLAEQAKHHIVFNTHKGLFRYTRLPYGVASAPGIFQRVMENVLQGLSHTAVYLDDILITSKDNVTH